MAHQSDALNALVNGEWKESKEKCAVWEKFDEETFLRFSQFAYTGAYDGAKPQKRKVEHPPPDPGNENNKRPDPPQRFMSLSPPYLNMSKRELLWDRFGSLFQKPFVPSTQKVNGPQDDYADVFVSHAQMYVFADYHGISDLQGLSLRNLRHELVHFELYPEGVSDIVQLVDYCFNNTANKGGQADQLRKLVCIYTACKLEDLWVNDEFKKLVDTLPELPGDLLSELMHRLD